MWLARPTQNQPSDATGVIGPEMSGKEMTGTQLAVRGLGDLAHAQTDSLKRYTSVALTAVMSGLEDAADTKDLVALEAMQALNKLATRIDRSQLDDVLMSVLLRIRPCFEKENAAVRAVAFELMAQLAACGDCDAYKEQLHTNMCALLLHLYDNHAQDSMTSYEPDAESSCLRATILLSYGYLVWYCPIDIVTQRLQETVVKCALIETITLIADAIHPSHLKADFALAERATFVQYVLEYLQSEQARTCTTHLRSMAAKAIASLIKLDPVMSVQETAALVLVLR